MDTPQYKFFGLLMIILFVLSITYVFITSSTITGFVTKTGQLNIDNSTPVVNYIYINETPSTESQCTDTPGDVTIDPSENSTTYIEIKTTLTDLNGDCDSAITANAYLCDGVGACDSGNADHTVGLSYDSQWGSGNRYCNYTGSQNMQFYETSGSWKINVTVNDGTGPGNLTKTWTYTSLRAIAYPQGTDTIDMGVLYMDQWNNGTGQAKLNNAGNVIIDLLWNATNFTGEQYSDEIDIDGTNYIIDDDASGVSDSGDIDQVFINETPINQVYFDPDSGLLTCSNVACQNENATMDIYWHIYIPAGLTPDTYNNTIEIETENH